MNKSQAIMDLLADGKERTSEQLARELGEKPTMVRKLIDELQHKELLSYRRSGRIYYYTTKEIPTEIERLRHKRWGRG